MNAQHYIANFKATPAWKIMSETVEDSPWHREESVAVHTEMVIDQYMTRFYEKRTERQNNIALIALLYHDVGKPEAEETLDKKDGSGQYRRYAGHEQVSAIAFMEAYVTDPLLREVLDERDARAVRFIIEHHLPYGLKDGKKRSDLRTAIEHTLREDVDTFYDCLRSDSAGRISDDHETKLRNVEDWIREFRTVPLTINRINSKMGNCYIMVGPSGVGKSTWAARYRRECDRTVSLDDYRLEFYAQSHDDMKVAYAEAWAFCNDNEAAFRQFVDKKMAEAFQDVKVTHGAVFVDNANGSKKARARWIQAARNIGMQVVAVEFWSTLDTVIARQQTRLDKSVPKAAVIQQFNGQTLTLLGSEVDEVITVVAG